MIYFVFYDIENDKIRKKISDRLIEFGFERLQYSVFTCPENFTSIDILYHKLKEIMKNTENPDDNIIILGTSKESVRNMITLGKNNFDKNELIGEKNTLIF
jgi:CRISPR-associated protein Cas2